MKITASALSGITVVELSSPATRYAGKLFADMGADVILVEPPAGSRERGEGPFVAGIPGTERSLSFAYYNTSKRGITLTLDRREGRSIFSDLVSRADILLEGEPAGAMVKRKLDYAELARCNPKLVMTSISPFGQTGPYAEFEGEDLVAIGMGGFMYLSGYPDSSPLRPYGKQAYAAAGMYAAVASMLAVTATEATGEGEHVDVSMQECVVMAMETAVQYYDLERTVRKRFGPTQRFAGTGVFPCKDGFIYMMAAGIGAHKFWSRSLEWFAKEEVPNRERLEGEEWLQIEYVASDEAKRIFHEVFAPWALTWTKHELYHRGQANKVPLAPVNSPRDILASKQLEHRGYFVDVEHAQSPRGLRMPGAPYKLSRTPWRIHRPAPRLGEHNDAVYGWLGYDPQSLDRLRAAGVI
jgi:benzylsuccinate CoA-transferase BbsE subunit